MKRLMFGLLVATGLAVATASTLAAAETAPAKSAVYTTVNGAPVASPVVAGAASGPIQEVGWRARAYRRGYVAPYGVYRPYVAPRPLVYGGYYGGYAPYSYGGYSYGPYGTYYRGPVAYPAYGTGYSW